MVSQPRRAKASGSAELALALEQCTGHRFADPEMLRRALTHASARNSDGIDYERFEFLGDRVLGLIIADLLFKSYPKAPEGELSVRLNALVNAETLAAIAEEIGLPELVRVGPELRGVAGKRRTNLRADSLEALIAALYLDGGLDAAKSFVHRYWLERSRMFDPGRRDPKTELQEWAHQSVQATPTYHIDSREGPDHDPVFTVTVSIAGLASATGSGRSKREAEQAAAEFVLLREGVWKREGEPK
ncbi:MAG: ribonuclease III [Rhizobiaceae bacterium]|nr:ribonuclease III [Rhizobiaceae bacterium]